ncbi:MAG: hypothetical protein KKC19_04040 [Nanoarchaeota archaeon]|nr:hypothetical protein [Nanoarchaeota archaeon]
MKNKMRHSAPKCEGRFGELRASFHETARDLRVLNEDPFWSVMDYDELNEVVEWSFGGDFAMTSLYDAVDPYFNNRRDLLRGDPLVGEPDNWKKSLIPFVFEGMRETLRDDVLDAKTRVELGERDFSLERLANHDSTIVQHSVSPELIDDYAKIYLDQMDVQFLQPLHRGVCCIDSDLGMDLTKVMVPTKGNNGKKEYVSLSGHFLKAEFGTGLNISRTLVSSAPYRFELHKRKSEFNFLDNSGCPLGKPVLGVSFYLRHPDTAVIYQIQDIRGERVPNETTDGLCALTLMEKIGSALGFKRLITYNHHTNPVRYLYPNDSTLANVLKMNFDESAHRLEWKPMITCKDGHIEGYEKEL